MLFDNCAEDDLRHREGHRATIIEDWDRERDSLRALPTEPFQTARIETARVDAKGCARVSTNRYSVPIKLVHLRIEYRLHATRIEFVHEGRVVASHPRLQGKHGIRVCLDHYLELLWHKPGALTRSLPLRQARDRGEWPAAYDGLWKGLIERFDETEAARQMLCVLMLHRDHDADSVLVAVELGLEYGSVDAGAISVLVRQLSQTETTAPPLVDLGVLARYERPIADLSDYDALLTRPSKAMVH
jgi:hypothetical protein